MDRPIHYATQEGTSDILVLAKNEAVLAELIRDVDGFYCVDFLESQGIWPAWAMFELGRKLVDLNREFQKYLDE